MPQIKQRHDSWKGCKEVNKLRAITAIWSPLANLIG
jgi:hypothetical protein